MQAHDVTAYVLAGGVSARMGSDKALLKFKGETLLTRTIHSLGTVASSVKILTGPSEARACSLRTFGHTVQDRCLDAGPLAGLEAALADTATEWIMLVAVDMPLLPASFLLRWRDSVDPHSVASVCVLEGRQMALPMLVSRRLSVPIRAILNAGRYRLLPAVIASAASGLHLFPVGIEVRHWFINVNTPDELAEASAVDSLYRPDANGM